MLNIFNASDFGFKQNSTGVEGRGCIYIPLGFYENKWLLYKSQIFNSEPMACAPWDKAPNEPREHGTATLVTVEEPNHATVCIGETDMYSDGI